MDFFKNLLGGNTGGSAYTLSGNGNGSYVVGNGSNSYTYSNASDAASALDDLNFGLGQIGGGSSGEGFGAGLKDFMGSDTMKGLGTVANIGLGIANIFNSRSALKQAKNQWEAENARANELMAMNKEKYETYKADKARLNSQYV